jgi:KDO2-lipid IV(A) lauroyltransferase
MLSWLPLAAVHALGRWLGTLVYRFSPGYARKLQANLIQAQTVDPELRTVSLSACAASAGEFASELAWVWCRPIKQVLAKVHCADAHVLDEAEAEGRGIVFLTPHLGCFEVTAIYYASRKPMTVLFKPPRQAALASALTKARQRPNLATAPASLGGVRQLFKALKRGQAIGLLPDQVPSDGDGQWALFYGREAYTMTLPDKLVKTTGAAIVLAVAERLHRGQGWRLHLQRYEGSLNPEAINLAMQHLIRRCPEQYLWGYNRYKAPGGVASPATQARADD